MVELTRRERDGLLLAAAADHQRNVVAEAGIGHRLLGAVVRAGERRALALDHRHDDLERLVELVEPVGERAELVSELVVLELEPARSETQDGAALAHHVERGDRLGQQRGIAIGVAGDQGAQLDVLGGRRQATQGGVGLQHRLVGGAEPGQLVEVVHHEDGVEAGRISLPRLRDDGGVELGDACAVGEVGYLKSEFDGHPVHVTTTKRGDHPV